MAKGRPKTKVTREMEEQISTLSTRQLYALDAYWVNRQKASARINAYEFSLDYASLGRFRGKTEASKVQECHKFFNLPSVQTYLQKLEIAENGRLQKVKDELLNITDIEGKDYNTVIREIEAMRQEAKAMNNTVLWSSMTDMLLKYKKASKEVDTGDSDRVLYYLPQRCCDCPLYLQKLSEIGEEETDELVGNN